MEQDPPEDAPEAAPERPQEPPKRQRKPATEKVRRETSAKVKLALTELQVPMAMIAGPFALADDEVDDIARVMGKLAARHPRVAAAVDAGDEASVYVDAAITGGKIVLRRHALLAGYDIRDPMGLLGYITYLRQSRGGSPEENTQAEEESPFDGNHADYFASNITPL